MRKYYLIRKDNRLTFIPSDVLSSFIPCVVLGCFDTTLCLVLKDLSNLSNFLNSIFKL